MITITPEEDFRGNLACAIGEHVGDVAHYAEQLNNLPFTSNGELNMELAASVYAYLAAAKAVLEAGLKSLKHDV
jgi:hypothetical protein